ncbi:MAG: hypothetical protein EOM50_11250 [Erysipelotrichia bacterium]|nr:hypothetical protein [Erysipelotrichia bacterium]NCC54224.1 hypothetical protein [Erysipelotrichia bacterium]
MKIFKYELLKYFRNKVFMVIFVVSLILCGIFYYLDASSQPINLKEYQTIHKKVDSLNIKEAKKYIGELQAIYSFYDLYQMAQNSEDVIVEFEQTKGYDWVSKALMQLKDVKVIDTRANQALLERLNKELDNIENYPVYRKKLIEQSSVNETISIFKGKTNLELNKKILNVYQKVDRKLSLTLSTSIGIERLLSYTIPNVFCIILIIYMIGVTIYQERNKGFFAFTKTMQKGGRAQFYAKLATLIVYSSAWLLFAYIICGILTSFIYALPALETTIQSIPLFMKSTIQGNILVLLVVFMLFKIVTISLLTCLFYIVAQHISSYFTLVFTLVIFFVVSYLAYIRIPELSALAIFKYINLYFILQPVFYLSNYVCYTFLQIPLSIFQSLFLLTLLVMMLVIIVSYQQPIKIKKDSPFKKRKVKMQPHSLFFYECKKVWIKDFGIVFFTILLSLQFFALSNMQPNITMDDIYYNNFIDTIGAKVTKKGDELIYSLNQRYLSIQSDRNENDYKEVELWNRYPSFLKYQKNYLDLKEKKKGELLKNNEYFLLFENNLMNQIAYLLLITGIIVTCVSSFSREKETRLDELQFMSSNGGNVLWSYKIFAILSFVLPLCLILYSSIILRNHYFFTQIQYTSNITNLTTLQEFKMSLSISKFLWVSMFIRLVFSGMLVIITSYITKKIQSRYSVITITIFISMVGFLIAEIMKNINFNPLYCVINISLSRNIVVVFCLLIIFSIIAFICYKKAGKMI